MHFSAKVLDRIIPLSVSGSLSQAFEEWYFTETTRDHQKPIEVCQLCGKDGLRYHFQIRNELTDVKLWVGSHCILQFGLSVYEDGRRLSANEAQKKLDRLTSKMRFDSTIRALEKLAEKEEGPIILGALAYLKTNKKLTPRYASIVLWRLNERRIDHCPSFFKVALRREDHKEALRNLKPRMFDYLCPALTSSQRKLADALRSTLPDTCSACEASHQTSAK